MKDNVLTTEYTQQLKMYRDNSWPILFNLYPLTHFPPLEIIFEVNPRHITLCTSTRTLLITTIIPLTCA